MFMVSNNHLSPEVIPHLLEKLNYAYGYWLRAQDQRL